MVMITAIHILIALASVAYLAYLLFSRQSRAFALAYTSVAATLGSGVLLMMLQPHTIAHVCVSGTVYLMVAIAAITFAKYRQAKYFTALDR